MPDANSHSVTLNLHTPFYTLDATGENYRLLLDRYYWIDIYRLLLDKCFTSDVCKRFTDLHNTVFTVKC